MSEIFVTLEGSQVAGHLRSVYWCLFRKKSFCVAFVDIPVNYDADHGSIVPATVGILALQQLHVDLEAEIK